MEGSRGPGEDSPWSLGLEWGGNWNVWRSGTAIQRRLGFGGLLIFLICLGWFWAHFFGAGAGERKRTAGDQTEMTAMHSFFALLSYFFLHRAHITVILYKQAWFGTAGVRGHVETEIIHDISFGGSKVTLTGNVLVKVQHAIS